MTAPSYQRLTEKTKTEHELDHYFKENKIKYGEFSVPGRKAPGTIGHQMASDTNMYQVQTSDLIIYRYDVQISGRDREGKEFALTKRRDNEIIIMADRMNNCREVFKQIFLSNPNIFGTNENAIYYDLQSILYTLKPLKKLTGSTPLKLFLQNSANVILPGNLQSATMTLKNVHEKSQHIKLNDLSALIHIETLNTDRSVLNFIELAIKQLPMFNQDEFITLKGPMTFFSNGELYGLPDKKLDKGGTKYLASGVKISSTLIEGYKGMNPDPNQRKIGVSVESKHKLFHTPMPLIDCIKNHVSTESIYDSFIRGQLNEHQLAKLTNVFSKMYFVAKYRNGKDRRIHFGNFDTSTANSQIIRNLNQSVFMYYQHRYQQELRHPNAHLVCIRQGNQSNFYPPEILSIADNQTVHDNQMDAVSKTIMVLNCAIRPDYMKQSNDNAKKAIHLHKSQYTSEAGIQFSKKPLQAVSRKLPSPTITFGEEKSQKISEHESVWPMCNFYQPSNIDNFAIYLISSSSTENLQLSQSEILMFGEMIQFKMLKLGVCQFEFSDSNIYSESQMEECVDYCHRNDIKVCMFITSEASSFSHEKMKLLERNFGVITQDYKVSTVQKILNGSQSLLENCLSKTNIKGAGINYLISTTDSEIMYELKNTLFIGIAINQPGSKTTFDRFKSGGNEKPGVLGYCANFGANYNEYIGDFYYVQSYRIEFYKELEEIFKICVKRFTSKRGNAPKKIIFYYTGLTEGQFKNAYKYGIPLIKNGIKNGNNGTSIPLTLIAVQKKNNVRLFPLKFPSSNSKPINHEFNVPHGTVVDTTIVHPIFPEFYLMPHSAQSGTANVGRYTIILDENHYSMDILEGVTHILCYEHQIDGVATSLPSTITIAEEYAQRGRDIFNAAWRKAEQELPRYNDGSLDLIKLSNILNYANSAFHDRRITA